MIAGLRYRLFDGNGPGVKTILILCDFVVFTTRFFMLSLTLFLGPILSPDMTKPTKWLCAQRRLRSAWAFTQSDQSSLRTQPIAKDLSFLHADSEDSDQTGRSPRLGRSICFSCICMFILHVSPFVFLVLAVIFDWSIVGYDMSLGVPSWPFLSEASSNPAHFVYEHLKLRVRRNCMQSSQNLHWSNPLYMSIRLCFHFLFVVRSTLVFLPSPWRHA